MKNTFKYYAGMLLIGVTLANISCSSDEDGITPAEITNLTAESTSGRIVLRWDTPEDAGIRYIEVNYYDPLQKKMLCVLQAFMQIVLKYQIHVRSLASISSRYKQ